MKRFKRFLLYWIHNSVFLYLSTQIFPGKFVLGNARFDLVQATVLSGLILTIIFEVAKKGKSRVKKPKFDHKGKHMYYLLVNFIGLWVIARLAPYFGFGVVKFTWLLGLAVVLNIVQKCISMCFEKK